MFESLGVAAADYWDLYALRVLQAIATIVAVLVGAKILRTVATRLTERMLKPREGAKDYALQLRRSQTLKPLMLEVQRYVIYFVVTVTILAQVGIEFKEPAPEFWPLSSPPLDWNVAVRRTHPS